MLYHPPTGIHYQTVQPAVGSNTLRSLSRDTAVLLSDLTQGASNWIQSLLDPTRTLGGTRSLSPTPRSPQPIEARSTSAHGSVANCEVHMDYPEGFEPLRSECLAFVSPTSCPIIRNPFVSPLLAPCDLLRGLPPVHIVVRKGRVEPVDKPIFYDFELLHIQILYLSTQHTSFIQCEQTK